MKQLKLQYRDDDVNTRKLLEEAPPEKRVCLWLLNEAYFCVEIKHSIEDVSLEAGSSIIMVRTMTGECCLAVVPFNPLKEHSTRRTVFLPLPNGERGRHRYIFNILDNDC